MALDTASVILPSYLAINVSGGTTSGSAIIGTTDFNLQIQSDSLEILHMEDNFNKSYIPTSQGWTMSANGDIVAMTGSTAIDQAPWAADAKLFSGTNKTKNGLDLLELAKTKGLIVGVLMKIKGGNWQVGKAIITSFSIDNSVSAASTFSIEFQGIGLLTKATS